MTRDAIGSQNQLRTFRWPLLLLILLPSLHIIRAPGNYTTLVALDKTYETPLGNAFVVGNHSAGNHSSLSIGPRKPVINRERPPYKSLLCTSDKNLSATCRNKYQLKGAIRGPIIDYAIIGFPKCSTTSMGQALGHLAQAPSGDTCASVHDAVYGSYHNWESKRQYGGTEDRVNQNILTGIKCPKALESTNQIAEWSRHLPDTKLILGIRHPVLWFESFYNFLTHNGNSLGSPRELVRGCNSSDKKCYLESCPNGPLCVERARFHLFMAEMGKTPLDEEERTYLPTGKAIKNLTVTNHVFLYEIGQLSDSNETQRRVFWNDLAGFLDFPHKISADNVHISPGKKWSDPKQLERVNKKKIDICENQYDELRMPLMEYATQISHWVCRYFLKSDNGVFVSSPGHFCEILRGWRQDPCEKRKEQQGRLS